MVNTLLPLKVKSATVKKKGATLAGPLDLELGSRGTTIVIGPNGSGKTTLLRMLHGLERPRTGSLHWNDKGPDIFKRQSFVFQTPIMMHRTVIANLTYPLRIRGEQKQTALQKAEAALQESGLAFARDRRATSLSGGEKQKLAIARALITKPEILFLDEPTTNLDGSSVKDIEATLLNVSQLGTRIVMATHDLAQARRLADHVIFMYRGQVLEHSAADPFFSGPATEYSRAFLKGDIVI